MAEWEFIHQNRVEKHVLREAHQTSRTTIARHESNGLLLRCMVKSANPQAQQKT